MSTFLRVTVAGVVCAFGAITSGHAQTVTCQNAKFSPEVLAKYPNVQKNCLDVVSRGGEHFAVVKAQLERANPTSVVVRVRQADGSLAQRTTLQTSRDLRVLVDGEPTRVMDLATGQELTAYVKVAEPVMALAPADDNEPLVTTPLDAAPEERVAAAALPETASDLPLLGWAGGAFLLLGGLLNIARRADRRG